MLTDTKSADGLVECVAYGERKRPDEMAHYTEHNTGGERQCLACHREIIRDFPALECQGCRGKKENR